MLGVFAEFETNLRRERQLEGIAKAKAACVYKGRPASIDAGARNEGAGARGASKIAKALKIGRGRFIGCWKPANPAPPAPTAAGTIKRHAASVGGLVARVTRTEGTVSSA
jgi:hypothetical protein